jgi:hypothetical protein
MARKPLLPREKSSFDLLQDERKLLEKQISDRGHLVNDVDRVWRAGRLREVKREINRLFAEGYKSRLR